MLNKFFFIFLSCLFFSTNSSAEKDLEGFYNIEQYPFLIILPNQDFVMTFVYGAVTGKYHINNENVELNTDDLKLPQFIFTELKKPITIYDYLKNEQSIGELNKLEKFKRYSKVFKPKADQLLIYFDRDLISDDLYIGINQPLKDTHLQKIYDEKSICLSDDEQFIMIPRKKDNNIILYQAKNENNLGIQQQYFVPDNINRIMLTRNEDWRVVSGPLNVKIQNDGLLFPEGTIQEKQLFIKKHPLSELGDDQLSEMNAFIRVFREKEKNKDEIYFKSQPVELKNVVLDNHPLLTKMCKE